MRHSFVRSSLLVSSLAAGLVAPACSRGGGGGSVAAPTLANVGFLGRFDIALGARATAVATGDVDGDGFVDAIVGRYTDSQVTLVRGLGGGIYSAGADLPVSPLAAFAVALGDLDGDSRPDLAVSDLAAQQISLYWNAGGGAFTAQTPVATALDALGIVIADLDGDGIADLAVAALNGQEIRVHRGLGAFAFDAGTSFPVAGQPARLAAALLDGDALPDLVFTDMENGEVVRWINASTPGTPAFAVGGAAATQPDPYGVAIGNVDGEPSLEIAVATLGFPAVAIWKQDALGLTPFASVGLPAPPAAVALGDVNGDGHADVVATLALDDAVAIAFGDGAGAFGAPVLRPAGVGPIDVAVADGNGDGADDVFVPGAESGQLTIVEGSAGAPQGPASFYGGESPLFLGSGDLDGDGDPELLVADAAALVVRILRNDGGLAFTEAAAIPVADVPAQPVVVDLDGDGDLDVAQLTGGGLVVLRNGGALSFAAEPAIAAGVELNHGVTADLDEDGTLEVIASNPAGATLRVFRIVAGSLVAHATVPAGAGAAFVAVADLDRDGRLDLVNTNMFANTVSVARRLPSGSYAGNAAVLPTGNLPSYVRVANTDSDLRPEIVVGHRDATALRLFRNRGKLSFDEETIPAAGLAQAVFLQDLNGDGRADLLYTENDTGRALVRLGNKNGTFGAITTVFHTLYVLTTPLLVDLDGDGLLDLAANSSQTGLVTVHRNLSQ